jgi:hypothetical protein
MDIFTYVLDTKVYPHAPYAGGTAYDNEGSSNAEGFERIQNTVEAIFSRDA